MLFRIMKEQEDEDEKRREFYSETGEDDPEPQFRSIPTIEKEPEPDPER